MCIRDRNVEGVVHQHVDLLGTEHDARDATEEAKADQRDEHCLLYTSDAADERSSVDLGGRRIIKKKNKQDMPESLNQRV